MNDKPAILGGTPVHDQRQWPRWPQWDERERDGLLAVLEHGGWWTGDGDVAQGFADAFARFHGARHALPFTNGTHTLEAALAACEVGDGDEVIVPGITFFASASAALAVNATPVLVDVDAGSLNIDPAAADAAITDRTRAIMAVHVAGAAADLDALTTLCARHELHLIEDCAHAHGTTWRGRGVGSYGSFGSFSMQRSKLMTAGEGGVLITDDAALQERAWSYWNCGRIPGAHWYDHRQYGSNMRMTEWQGAVLVAQLERFPEQHRVRNANAVALIEALEQIPGVRCQTRDPRMESQGNYCFVFHVDLALFSNMSLRGFEAALAAEGVPLGVSYPSLSNLDVFRHNAFEPRMRPGLRAPQRDYSTLSLPVAEHAAASTVWMEHRVLLADRDEVLKVASAVRRIQVNAPAITANELAAA